MVQEEGVGSMRPFQALVLAALAGIILLVAVGLPAEAHARSSAGRPDAGFWWDNDRIIFTGVDSPSTEIAACKDIKNQQSRSETSSDAARDRINTEIIACLKKEDPDNIPRGASLNYQQISDREYTSIPGDAKSKYTIAGAVPGTYSPTYYCTVQSSNITTSSNTGNNSTRNLGLYTLKGCWRLEEERSKSWHWEVTRHEADADEDNWDNSTIFINTTGGEDTARIWVRNNTVTNIDVDSAYDSDLDWMYGDIKSYVNQPIRGKPGISFKQSSTEEALNKQKERMKNEYYAKCNERARTPDSPVSPVQCQQSNGAFDVIWHACAIATGNSEGDINNAAGCFRVYAGVELDTEKAIEGIPPDPVEGSMYKCNVDMIGYIICPLMNFMAGAADGMFGAMKKLLEVSPLDRNEPGGRGAYNVWSRFRDVANVLLVIAILAIVLSQVSSYGITNYGAKKILPKIIVGALIINVSFFICAALLDLSNILGDSLHSVLLGVNDSLPKHGDFITAEMGGGNISGDGSGTALNWAFVIGLGLAGAGAVLAVVVMFVPILTAVLIALVTVLLMLLARHALIVLLTIAAPIALACYALPNTRKWFSKWKTTYLTLLMMYPAIAIIFGLSTIAANVILQIGTNDNSMTLRMFALAIQTIPLMVTPIVMKLGGQTLGNVGNSIRNSGIMRGAKSGANEAQKVFNNSLRIRALKGGGGALGSLYRMKKIRDGARTIRQGEASKARARYVAGFIQGNANTGGNRTSFFEKAKEKASRGRYRAKTRAEKYRAGLGAPGGGAGSESADMALAYAKNISINLEAEEAKATKLSFGKNPPTNLLRSHLEEINNNSQSMDEAYKRAIIEMSFESGDEETIQAAVQATGNVSLETRKYILQAAGQSHLGAFMSNPTTQQAVLNGEVNAQNFSEKIIAPTINSGELSATDLKSIAKVGGIDAIQTAKNQGHITATGRDSLHAAIGEVLSNTRLKADLEDHEKSRLRSLR